MDILAPIIERRRRLFSLSAGELPARNVTVVHLRVGDVLDGRSSFDTIKSVEDALCNYGHMRRKGHIHYNIWVRPLSYFDAIHFIRPEHIELVAGSHCGSFCASHQRSCDYVHAVASYFRTRFPDTRVSFRIGKDPDDDLVYMSAAHQFVAGGGSFGQELIAPLVSHFGGTVLRSNCTIVPLPRESQVL